MLKLYEDFIKFDKLYDIIKQLENRINYWFSDKGTLSKDISLIDINSTLTDKYTSRSIIINFNNANYLYQCIFTLSSEDSDICKVTLKRYELEDQKLIDRIQEEVNINDLKEDYLINKIGEFEDKDDNPDKNNIEIEKEKKPESEEESENDETENDETEEENDNFELGGFNEEETEEDENFEF